MTLKEFELLMRLTKGRLTNIEYIRNLGIDLTSFEDDYDYLFELYLTAIWTKPGVEWIYWFIIDNEFGERLWKEDDMIIHIDEAGERTELENNFEDGFGAHDEKGNPICRNVKQLYEHIKQFERPIVEVFKNPIKVNKKLKH